MQKAPPPSDSLVAAYYDAHKAEFMSEEQIKVRHIQVADEKTAKDVKASSPRAATSRRWRRSTRPTRVTKDKGGDLGAVGEERASSARSGGSRRSPTARSTAPLNVPGPDQDRLGWHVYEVTGKVPAKPRALEEIKGVIVRQLTQQTNEDFYKRSLAQEKLDLHLSRRHGGRERDA